MDTCRKMLRRLVGAVSLALAAALVQPALCARAAAFSVTTISDADDGACTSTLCTLRDAIKYSSPGDSITFGAKVRGAIYDDAFNVVSAYRLAASCTATLSKCVLSGNSAADGGAMYAFGPMSLTACTLSSNSAAGDGAWRRRFP